MQWLIDIITEQLKQQVGYFHLNCPPTPHWSTPDLAASTAWITREASPFVPTGTRAILLRCFGEAPAPDQRLQIRAIGDIPWHNMGILRTQVANRSMDMDKIVTLNDALQFETKVSTVTWTTVYMTIQGYWKTGIIQNSFFNRGDPSVPDFTESDFPAYQLWETLDLSGIIPLNTKAVVLAIRAYSVSSRRSLRFRTHGNTNAINISQCEVAQGGLSYYYDITVPTNGLQKIDYWSSLDMGLIVRATVKGWCF